MIRRILSFILFLGATAASATPPDTIYVKDQLFGANETHLFFLRTANDNLGLHVFGMKDTYLVAKNIDTGLDDEIWPVLRQHGAPEYDEAGAPTALIQTFPLASATDPFAVLAERGALYITNPREVGDVPDDATLDSSGIVVGEFSLDADTLAKQMEHSVSTTLSAIQPYPDAEYVSMTFSTPTDLLGEWTIDLSECELISTYRADPIYGMRIVQLARIECWDVVQAQPATLYVILQPVQAVE